MKQNKGNSQPSLTDGRLQPQAIELEYGVLGALMLESNAFNDVGDILTAEDFYNPANQALFSAIQSLYSKRKPIDMLTVIEELKALGTLDEVGGPAFIADLTGRVSSSAHIIYHSLIIKQKSQARQLIRITSEIQSKCFDETADIAETIEELEKSFTELVTNTESCVSVPMAEALKTALDKAAKIQELREKGIRLSIPTGLNNLDDEFAGGWRSPDLIVIGARPSMGKALPMDAKILTPDGWVLNKDIKIGDRVSSIDGRESYVTGIYPQGIIKTYEIEFSDGRKTECCKDHLWEVHSSKFPDKVRVLDTEKIKDLLSKTRYKGRISIPMFSGDFGVQKYFVIHPYLLGILLGDGMLTCGVSWAKPDRFVVNKIADLILPGYKISEYSGDRYSITGCGGINIYYEELRRLGLENKLSQEKFIPEQYLNTSRSQRIELLNGLLDSDGDIDKLGSICFNSVSERLAKDVQSLCWSLGYKCSIRKRKSYLYGKRMKDSFRLVIAAKDPDECFSLPRKRERARFRKPKPLTIVSVKEKSVSECQCISVSHERCLYITDDYIVTHNTQMALSFAKAAALSDKHVFFASIEMTSTQLVNRYLLENNRINSYNLRTGQMTDEEWQAVDETAGKLWNMKLHIADSHNIRYLNNIKSEARKLKRKGKLDVMIIDYLGLIKTNMKFASRYLEIGYITGELKNLCKELDVPIILLSQLNRPVKGMAVKEPQLEDLRESGDIEQDADIVLFIHKPDYYDPEAQDSKGEKWKGRGKLIIAKYREGARNNAVIYYHDERYKKIWDTPHSSPVSYTPSYEPIPANTEFTNEGTGMPF